MINSLCVFLCLFTTSGKSQQSQPELVDKVEINTCWGEFKQVFNRWELPVYVPSYKQIIIYRWDHEYSRYDVRHWQLIETSTAIESKLPDPTGKSKEEIEKDKINFRPNRWYGGLVEESKVNFSINLVNGIYHIKFTQDKINYYITTKVVTYTDTDAGNDPERTQQKFLDSKYRVPLRLPLDKIKRAIIIEETKGN